MGFARYQRYPGSVTKWFSFSSLFARWSDTSCFVQNTAECCLAQKIGVFSAKSQWTHPTRSWWMIMSLWRDTWVTADNSDISVLASWGRVTEISTPPPQVPMAVSPESHKFLVWPQTMHPGSHHIPCLHSFLSFPPVIPTTSCTLGEDLVPSGPGFCGHVPGCPAEEVMQRRGFRQTTLFSSVSCCPWFASFKSRCKGTG